MASTMAGSSAARKPAGSRWALVLEVWGVEGMAQNWK